ncbi:sugar ABC transporter ATP-binding protein [PVC group bacterium]|nr:sugar ABC transporter ATP-binding protein [PVC group bacterium]
MSKPNSNTQSDTLLKMKNIRKQFSGVEVLHDVGFDLRAGEVHILAGENGAGKSTLIKILGGVYTDHSGSIELNGRDIVLKSVHDAASAGISVIHQELSLIGSLNVSENIFLGKEKNYCQWLDKAGMIKYSKGILKKFDLDIDLKRAVDGFPIGIQQMIEIAKALAFNAKIIVMDEPTSALSEPEVKKLFEIIKRLIIQGCSIVYITHKMEEIYTIADRITVLRDGQHIGSEAAENLPCDKLIEWMVGRELNQQFPRHTPHIGKVRLQVNNFFVPGTATNPAPRVDDISFGVRAGEILGIQGLQGSGNSELLNGIFGAYGKNAKGSVEIDGNKCTLNSPLKSIRKGLALLTNDRKTNGLVMNLNIVTNSTLACLPSFSRWFWLRPVAERKDVKETAKSLNLKANSLNQKIDSLSGGNQQKVVMAKWIQTNPKVLLLDEPTKGVDVGAKHEIYELMNQWTKKGVAIVLITSEMSELLAMSDRIIVMHRGKVTARFGREEATRENLLSAALGKRRCV